MDLLVPCLCLWPRPFRPGGAWTLKPAQAQCVPQWKNLRYPVSCSCSKEVQMAVLLKFVSEGDNVPDALGLAEYLNEWLQLIKPQVSVTQCTLLHGHTWGKVLVKYKVFTKKRSS